MCRGMQNGNSFARLCNERLFDAQWKEGVWEQEFLLLLENNLTRKMKEINEANE